MTPAEIIDAILANENITASQLAEDIGMSRPQGIYDIQKGKVRNISGRMANLIHNAKPMYRKEWLLTGEGEMLDINMPTKRISAVKEQVDALSVINQLIVMNAQKDEELHKLRLAFERMASALEELTSQVKNSTKE